MSCFEKGMDLSHLFNAKLYYSLDMNITLFIRVNKKSRMKLHTGRLKSSNKLFYFILKADLTSKKDEINSLKLTALNTEVLEDN